MKFAWFPRRYRGSWFWLRTFSDTVYDAGDYAHGTAMWVRTVTGLGTWHRPICDVYGHQFEIDLSDTKWAYCLGVKYRCNDCGETEIISPKRRAKK